MNRHPRYLLALAIPMAMLAAGCADHGTKPTATGTSTSSSSTSAPVTRSTTQTSTSTSQAASSSSKLPEKTGIPACDNYLASYKGCHRAAGIYAPDTIDKHYQEMRDTLLKESRDPAKRSDLAARCVSLSNLLKKALHGKSCEAAQPATASSSSQ